MLGVRAAGYWRVLELMCHKFIPFLSGNAQKALFHFQICRVLKQFVSHAFPLKASLCLIFNFNFFFKSYRFP